jgi:peptidyl-tRNA hydrolase
MKKMYIVVIDEAPDYMVPTLVAHSVMNAHDFFKSPGRSDAQRAWYDDWNLNSFRKVVVKVPGTVFDKIHATLDCWAGHERTICNGATTCLVVNPVESDDVPKPLQYAQLWKPVQPPKQAPEALLLQPEEVHYGMLPQHLKNGVKDLTLKGGLFAKAERYFKAHAAMESGVYVVQPGDTLSQIGKDVGVHWGDLARTNDIKDPNVIRPGQIIRLR